MEMKMGMSLSQSLSMRQELSQRIELSYTIELKMVQKIFQLLRDLRKEIDPDDKRMALALDQTFDSMSKVLSADQVTLMRTSLKGISFGKEEPFLEGVLENSGALLFEGEAGVRKLTARLLAKAFKMRGDVDVQFRDLSEVQIANVMQEPEVIESKITELQALIDALGINKSTEMTLTHLNEAKSLKALHIEMKPYYDEVSEFLETILNFPSIGENPLRRALVDFYMMDQAAILVSERMVKRFAAVFSRAKKDLTMDKLSVGAANIIGEYILVGMGVIDPEIFKVMSGEAKYTEDDKIVLDEGRRSEIKSLMAKYNLRNGRFFYNSYATLMVRPGSKSDDLIRKFLTNDVREVRGELCAAVGLSDLINGYLEELEDLGKEEAGENLMRQIEISLCSGNFKQLVSEIIKNKLMPRLVMTATGVNILGKKD